MHWYSPSRVACIQTSPTATWASANCIAARANPEQAQEHLTTAIAMHREMGMTYWLEQAEVELRQLG
jgi:hypothetical protein